MTEIKGYKVFNPDWTCSGFKYKVGETYKHTGDIGIYGEGVHFCKNLADCFSYYGFDINNKVAEVVAEGKVITEGKRSVTNILKIVKELTWEEVFKLVNTGNGNAGYQNTGDRNTGNRNTGSWNTGSWSTGNCNTGDCNTGDWNTGDCNTGDWNTGDCNTGNCNTGSWNTGSWNTGWLNACNHATGFFNSVSPNIYMFNKPTNLSRDEFLKKYDKAFSLLSFLREYSCAEWIDDYKMFEREKTAHPEYKTTGGYLKVRKYKECFADWWENLKEEEKQEIQNLPNFDVAIFKEITGIDITGERK